MTWLLKLYFSSRAQGFSLALLLLSMLPALGLMPTLLLPLLLMVVLAQRFLRQQIYLRWGCLLLVLAVAAALVHTSAKGWLSADALITLLVCVLVLKWVESGSDREYRLVTLASLILAALSSLYLPSLPAMAYLMLAGVLALMSLLLINDSEQRLSWGALFKQGLVISLLILPVTAVLFITVPRVQGPLWDLGIAIGLPIELAIDQDARDIGLKGSLKAGQVSRLKKSDAPVLVAEFSSVVPYKSRMYWRGPVFADYDGIAWSLPDNWDKRSNLLRGAYRGKTAVDETLTSKRDKVHYEARVSPHAGHWLYSLDMPSGQTPEALISKDLQLLGIRKISWEFKYDIYAWLEYSGGRQPSAQERAAYLAYPAASNPRLRAFGESLRADYPIEQGRIDALYKHFATAGYQMSLTSDIAEGMHSLDTYFFDAKVGTIEHLASSTAMVLRAAGIPTRLITGYRGGSLIALTDYVVVKQEHAHVWVEAWTKAQGWQRVEAKDLVVPPEKKAQAAATKTTPQPAAKPAQQPTAANAQEPPPVADKKQQQANKPKPTQAAGSSWEWLKKLSSGAETWVLNYNPDRQIELLKKSGLRKVDWKNLLALSFIGLLVLALVYALLLKVKGGRRDPVVDAFARLNRAFAKLGIACAAQECPSQWLKRVQLQQPELYPALKQVVDQYMALRYGGQDSAAAQKLLVRDVKRLVAMM